MFCWGSNEYRQCGVDPSNTESKHISSPLQIGGLLKNVKLSQILSGWNHILVKTGKFVNEFSSCYPLKYKIHAQFFSKTGYSKLSASYCYRFLTKF